MSVVDEACPFRHGGCLQPRHWVASCPEATLSTVTHPPGLFCYRSTRSVPVIHLTPRCSGPGFAMLTPAAERERRLTMPWLVGLVVLALVAGPAPVAAQRSADLSGDVAALSHSVPGFTVEVTLKSRLVEGPDVFCRGRGGPVPRPRTGGPVAEDQGQWARSLRSAQCLRRSILGYIGGSHRVEGERAAHGPWWGCVRVVLCAD